MSFEIEALHCSTGTTCNNNDDDDDTQTYVKVSTNAIAANGNDTEWGKGSEATETV